MSSLLPSQEKYRSTKVLTNAVKSIRLMGHRPVLCFFSKPDPYNCFHQCHRVWPQPAALVIPESSQSRSQESEGLREQQSVLSTVKSLAVPCIY